MNTTIELSVHERQIVLHFNSNELKFLPKDTAFIAICNQIKDLDKVILDELFQQVNIPVQSCAINKKIRLKNLAQATEQQVLALSIPFHPATLRGIRKSKQVRAIIKHLKAQQVALVPIHLVLEEVKTLQAAKLKQNFQKTPIRISARIGKAISVQQQASFENSRQFRKFIQSKIYALGTNLEVSPKLFRPLKLRKKEAQLAPITPAIAKDLIQAEIKQLRYQNLIASRANFDILVADATEIPNSLQEIGRLRELTFREVGEGTGKAIDLDEYDLYYKQLIIWDRDAQRIVGGYRMGEGDKIFRKYGVEGFYIHSLFKIKKGFYPIMQKSIELGRSYIVPDYQKQRLPLFLLWKGILFFLLRHPQYEYLYGPMSISKYYSDISKGLIVAFVKKYYFNDELAQYLKARNPFQFKSRVVDMDALLQNLDNKVRSLDSFVEDVEPNHFRIPVLLKQYLKLNARFISFNVDPNFSDVLDGFILLNLKDVPYSVIENLQKEA